jgi:hypothetical protein
MVPRLARRFPVADHHSAIASTFPDPLWMRLAFSGFGWLAYTVSGIPCTLFLE